MDVRFLAFLLSIICAMATKIAATMSSKNPSKSVAIISTNIKSMMGAKKAISRHFIKNQIILTPVFFYYFTIKD